MGQVLDFPQTGDELLRKAQVARMLRRSPRWVNLQMKENGLPYWRPGGPHGHPLFRWREVEAWMQRRSA